MTGEAALRDHAREQGVEAVYGLTKLSPLTETGLAGIKKSAAKVQSVVDSLKAMGKL